MAELMTLDGWTLRVRTPQGPGSHPLILMLHGLSGNEDVMWIFASRLPQSALLVAPRAPYPSSFGGNTWIQESTAGNGAPRSQSAGVSTADFDPALHALDRLLSPANFPTARLDRIGLVGFSQGAALAYTFALSHPERVAALAGLAGFAPLEAEVLAAARPLDGRRVFITHGTQDAILPYEHALRAKDIFEAAGANVTLCSDDVGHKLSAGCFRGLQGYFSQFENGF